MRTKPKLLVLVLVLILGLLVGCTNNDKKELQTDKELQINIEGEGTVSPAEGKHTYQEDKKVTLEAEPADGKWCFKRWKGSINRTANPTEIVMDSDLGVTAVFEREGFKLVNSWGANWGPNGDGTLYMTYDAALENNLPCFIMEPRNTYEPKAIALFEMDHPQRGDWEFHIQVQGRTDNQGKYFYSKAETNEVYQKGGDHPFPENQLVMDITELIPFEGETIELEVTNQADTDSLKDDGILQSFEIQIYDDYSSPPINTYKSGGTPISISTAGGSKTAVIENVSASSSAASFNLGAGGFNLKSRSEPLTEADIDRIKPKSDGDYNELVNGHGTGWQPLTEEEWKTAMEKGSIRKLDAQKILAAAGGANETVDHSQSKYFPPIGNQGAEGSCVAWSTAYYGQGFYEAREHDWDLSSTPDPAKLMSPEFVFHLINGGKENSSHYLDAIRLIENIGVASLEKMPYSDDDYTSWPSIDAFKEAPKFRSKNNSDGVVCYYLELTTEEDIAAIKELLRQGYLITVPIDANQYKSLNETGVWTADNYHPQQLNHANTIVGFYQ